MQIQEINKIIFTPREIDVLACVVHDRGVKKIANILGISPRTIEGHIKNILLKIEANSQEGIKDFIEYSPKVVDIKKHYIDLKIKQLFIFQINKLARTLKGKNISCILDHQDNQNLKYISDVFQGANIKVLQQAANKDVIRDYKIIELTNENIIQLKDEVSTHKIIYVIFDVLLRNKIKKFSNVQIIDCSDKEEIYSSIFRIIEIIYSGKDVAKLILEFNQFKNNITNLKENLTTEIGKKVGSDNPEEQKRVRNIMHLGIVISIAIIVISILLAKLYIAPSNSKYEL